MNQAGRPAFSQVPNTASRGAVSAHRGKRASTARAELNHEAVAGLAPQRRPNGSPARRCLRSADTTRYSRAMSCAVASMRPSHGRGRIHVLAPSVIS